MGKYYVESGMFVGAVPPWAKMGTSVADAQSSAEALKLAGMDWKVTSEPIQVVDGNPIKGFRANVRDIDKKVLGVVTDRYKIVQNEDAFAFTDMLLGEGVKYETAGVSADGKRVWMLAKMETAKVLGEDVEPYLVFTNSFDGKGAVKVAMTPIRVVCANAIAMALSKAERVWSTRHSGDIESKIQDARKTLLLADSYMEELKETADLATQIIIPHPMLVEYLNAMFPVNENMSDRQKANTEYQKNALLSIYNNKDDIQRFKGTGYGLMLAATDFATHFEPLRKTSTFDENRFFGIVDGNKLIDNTTKFVFAA